MFRIGQGKPVRVYLPISRHPEFADDSFDVRLDSLLSTKRTLNRTLLAPMSASRKDVEELYRTTVGQVGDEGDVDSPSLDHVDLWEPLAFERWVLRQLDSAGYEVRATPYTDAGADGLVIGRFGDSPHTVLVQCKHSQSRAPLGPSAVRELVASTSRYRDWIQGKLHLLVVTNAENLSSQLKEVARAERVELISRHELSRLSHYRPADFAG